MGTVFFYHLTQKPLEATLQVLLRKAVAAEWRVVVRGTNAKRLEWLDRQLWLGQEDEFLAHGLAGGLHDSAQPILLTVDTEVPAVFSCLISVDGAVVRPDEVIQLERVCILFDGNAEDALTAARLQWKAFTAAGCTAQYWSEANGKWKKG